MNPSGAKILIVDDDEDILVLMKAVLEHAGFSVRCADHATQALSMAREDKPRLIITDVMMPEISGVDLCRILKQDPSLKDIILFVLSARSDLQTKLECLKIGVEEYLVKPVHSMELSARVSHFLEMMDGMRAPGTVPGDAVARADGLKRPATGSPSPQDAGREQEMYGPYRVVAEAGRGGMGTVLKAFDDVLERHVAIKILAPQFSGSHEFAERFRREARALAAIDHPGIAGIYSLGQEKGRHYFAMQWFSGGSLNDLLEGHKRLEPVFAIDIVLQCARALEAAAMKGIVHRDVKPTNIMLDEARRVKIVDFGLARLAEGWESLTQSGLLLGTPGYMSPEQAQGTALDFRADIYSLGIMFYRMLSGRLPFEGASPVDMVLKHISAPFPSYEEDSAVFMPRAAYDIIKKMTEKQPALRYQDYSVLIRDLEAVRSELLRQKQFRIPHATGVSSSPDLRSDSIFDLMALLDFEDRDGVLTVGWSTLQKKYLVRRHSIVFYESVQPVENIWPRMVQRGVLQQGEAPDEARPMEEALGQLMLSASFKSEDFKKAYSELMRSSIMEVFLWPECKAEFHAARIEHEALSSISIREILLEAARGVVPLDYIRERLPDKGFWAPAQSTGDLLQRTNLQREEVFLLSRLEGGRMSAAELQATTGLPPDRVQRILFVLEKLKLVRFEEQARKPAPVRKAPLPPVREKTSVPPAPIAEETRPGPADPDAVRMEVKKSEMEIQIVQQAQLAEQYYLSAEQKWEQGDYWRAADFCEKAIRMEPKKARYHHLRGLSYMKHPRFQKEAELAFREAVQLEPDNPEYPLALAELYLQGGLPARATQECLNAVRIAPNHEPALRMLAQLQGKKK